MTDPEAAGKSLRMFLRGSYGQVYWALRPNAPLSYHLPTGGTLLLEPAHAFTDCFWPDVDRYEPDVRRFISRFLKPGMTFIDCGANVGYFSVQAGVLVGSTGKVVAIEANPRTFELLKRNLSVNGFGIPVACALTSQAGEVELYVPNGGDVYSSLRADAIVIGQADRSFRVNARTLDEVISELHLAVVHLVKIDIEGGECDVLQSAQHLLGNLRPTVITEYGVKTWASFGSHCQDLKELAHQHRYSLRLFDLATQRLIPIPENTWHLPFANLIMVPIERLEGTELTCRF